MSVTIALKPLYPFFLGGVKELRPTTAPLSRHIPSIYTVGGIVLTVLQRKGFDAEELERLILDGELRILGAYMSVDDRSYVPAPFTLIRKEAGGEYDRLALIRIVEEQWAEGLFKRAGFKVPFDPSVRVKHAAGLVPIDRLPEIDVKGFCGFRPRRSEKLGIAIDRFKRTTLRPYLYTRVDVEGVEAGKGSLAFCVDVEGSADVVDVLGRAEELIRFGGEGSIAVAAGCPECGGVLAKKVVDKLKEGGTYLAVSHVRVGLVDKEFSVRVKDEVFSVEWCVGRVEPISGWLLRKRRPKKTVAALVPGSVFKVKRFKGKVQLDEWYFNLLSSVVEIKVS